MDNDSLKVIETDRFKEEADRLFESGDAGFRAAIIWALTHNPFFGQQVINSDQWAWVLYRSGFAYIAFYSISGNNITLESIIKRKTPISPGPLGLEP
jgi:hypothetical protein